MTAAPALLTPYDLRLRSLGPIVPCEPGSWKAYDLDPYRVREILGNPLHPEAQQVGTNHFVRSVNSIGRVWEGDLPAASVKAMHDRIEREWHAYCRAHPDDPFVKAHGAT